MFCPETAHNLPYCACVIIGQHPFWHNIIAIVFNCLWFGVCRLAEKIRAARVNKERSLQLQEKAALVAQEAEYDRVYDKVGRDQLSATAQFQVPICRRSLP
jgi:hypothetical protein